MIKPIAILLLAVPFASIKPIYAESGADRIGYFGYGSAKIGMNRLELERALGSSLVSDLETEGCEYLSASNGHMGVSFMLVDGRLARIDVTSPEIRTVSGAQVGSTQTSVVATYPRIQVAQHHYAGPHGAYLTQYSQDGNYGIRFETDNEKVDMYYAGTAEAVQFVEGCL